MFQLNEINAQTELTRLNITKYWLVENSSPAFEKN